MKTQTFYTSDEDATDFHTSNDEGDLHHAEFSNLAAITLVSFSSTNGNTPYGGLIADAHGDLFGTKHYWAGRTTKAQCSRSPRPLTATPAPPPP
jgi:hypothetical protein